MEESRRVPTSPPSPTFHAHEVTAFMIRCVVVLIHSYVAVTKDTLLSSHHQAFPDGLPPLPPIQDDRTRRQVFTHKSFYGRPTREFEARPTDPRPDNESLEHLGDTVIQYCTTLLIRKLYPYLSPGPATVEIASSLVLPV
jgi:hypothetical protein